MFLKKFPGLLDFCNNLSRKCITLGDMNVHFDFPKNPCTAKLLSYLDMFSFSQAVNEPTHERGHTLDWVMFRSEDNVLRSASVTHSIASDHYCVVCGLCIAVPSDPAVYRESRNIRAIDRPAFRADLNRLVCPELCPLIDNSTKTFDSVLERHAPLCRRKVRADRLEPWYRDVKDELEATKNHRRRAERRWVKVANTVHKQIFNPAKRLVAKIIDKAKSPFLGNEIANATSCQQLFSVCGRLIDRPNRSSPLPSVYPIPHVFNIYFVQKVQSIRADLDQQSMSLMSCRLTDQKVVSTLSSLHPITEV